MVGWRRIMDSWDTQQTAYLASREERFTIMLDVLEMHFKDKESFTVLDLACGPGSLTGRILARFPNARCIAADLDPALMYLGKQTWSDQKRIIWLDVNLCHSDWSVGDSRPLEWLKTQSIDAIVTTTGLHWLEPHDLVRVYLQLAQLQKTGDLILNGDHMTFPAHTATFQTMSDKARQNRVHQQFEVEGQSDYETWWADFRATLLHEDADFFGQLLHERDARFANWVRNYSRPIRSIHEAALSNAGYTEVGSIWQRYDNSVLLAVRGAELTPVKN